MPMSTRNIFHLKGHNSLSVNLKEMLDSKDFITTIVFK